MLYICVKTFLLGKRRGQSSRCETKCLAQTIEEREGVHFIIILFQNIKSLPLAPLRQPPLNPFSRKPLKCGKGFCWKVSWFHELLKNHFCQMLHLVHILKCSKFSILASVVNDLEIMSHIYCVVSIMKEMGRVGIVWNEWKLLYKKGRKSFVYSSWTLLADFHLVPEIQSGYSLF